MGAKFAVVDLTEDGGINTSEAMLQAGRSGTVDLDELRDQLVEIRDSLEPVLADSPADRSLHLKSMELDLTIGLEGRVWFIAKAKGEATLRLTWSRGT